MENGALSKGWRNSTVDARKVSTNTVRAIAPLFVFAVGVFGFHEAFRNEVGESNTLLSNMQQALGLLIGHLPSQLVGKQWPVPLLIARYTFPVVSIWVSLTFGWLAVRNRLRLFVRRFGAPHLVLAGEERIVSAIAGGNRKARQPVIVWTDEPRAKWIADLMDMGVPIVSEGRQPVSALHLERARSVALVGADDSANLALAATVMEEAGRLHRASALPLIIRADDPDLLATAEQRFASQTPGTIRPRLVSIPDIEARYLLRSGIHDLVERAPTRDRHILFFGYSQTVERYILRLLVGAHFRDGSRASVTVLDHNAELHRANFEARHPDASRLAPLTFVSEATNQPVMAKAILARAIMDNPPVLLLIELPQPSAALAAAFAVDALAMEHAIVPPAVAVRLNRGGALKLIGPAMNFGGADVLGDDEALLQERHDRLARSIHEFYLEGRLNHGERLGSRAAVNHWADLPETLRDDNRLLADLFSLKLRDIDSRIVDGVSPVFVFASQELEELAEAEHHRWMSARILAGWTLGETKDDKRRTHPDLVPYGELAEPVKQIDRDQILLISRLLARIGQRAVRDFKVLVPPDYSAEAVAGALARLASDHPDRAVVATGLVGAPQVAACLLAAHRAGYPVQPAFAHDTVLGSADSQLADLMRKADRLIDLSGVGDAAMQLAARADWHLQSL